MVLRPQIFQSHGPCLTAQAPLTSWAYATIAHLNLLSLVQLRSLSHVRSRANKPQYFISSDSQEALQSLIFPGQGSGQAFNKHINRSAKLSIQWCPVHSKPPENEIAHQIAKKSNYIRGVSRIFAGPNYCVVSCLTCVRSINPIHLRIHLLTYC